VTVKVKDRVLIKVLGFSYLDSAKLDVQGVRVLESHAPAMATRSEGESTRE
jgi:hypothetical protein